MYFATTKKLSIDVESLHFPMFSTNATNAKSRREVVMDNYEKYVVKSVGTLQGDIQNTNPVQHSYII